MMGGISVGVRLNILPNIANSMGAIGTTTLIQKMTIRNEAGEEVEVPVISGNMIRHYIYEAFANEILSNEEKVFLSEQAVVGDGYRYPSTTINYYEENPHFNRNAEKKSITIGRDTIDEVFAKVWDADVFGFMVAKTGQNKESAHHKSPLTVSNFVGEYIGTMTHNRVKADIIVKEENKEGTGAMQLFIMEKGAGYYLGGARIELWRMGVKEGAFAPAPAVEKTLPTKLKYLLLAIQDVVEGRFGAKRAANDIYIRSGEVVIVAVKGMNILPPYFTTRKAAEEWGEARREIYGDRFEYGVFDNIKDVMKFYNLL